MAATTSPTPASTTPDNIPTSTLSRNYLLRDLPRLDPRERTSIATWMDKLDALCGDDARFLHDHEQPRDASEFAKLQRRPYTTRSERDEVDKLYETYKLQAARFSVELYNVLVLKVTYDEHPRLKNLVQRGELPDSSDALRLTKNGFKLRHILKEMGSTASERAQTLLTTEWSTHMAAAYAPEGAKTVVLFADVTTCDAIAATIYRFQTNYEEVPAQRATPPREFIKVVLKLVAAEVPELKMYAERELVNMALGINKHATRCAFVSELVETSEQLMQSRAALYTPIPKTGALTALGGAPGSLRRP